METKIDEVIIKGVTYVPKGSESVEPTPGADFTIGQKVFIRTVTHYYTGRVIYVTDGMVHLDTAAWIADTGRFYNALESGKLSEVEPIIGVCKVNRSAIIDVLEWLHELPQEQK